MKELKWRDIDYNLTLKLEQLGLRGKYALHNLEGKIFEEQLDILGDWIVELSNELNKKLISNTEKGERIDFPLNEYLYRFIEDFYFNQNKGSSVEIGERFNYFVKSRVLKEYEIHRKLFIDNKDKYSLFPQKEIEERDLGSFEKDKFIEEFEKFSIEVLALIRHRQILSNKKDGIKNKSETFVRRGIWIEDAVRISELAYFCSYENFAKKTFPKSNEKRPFYIKEEDLNSLKLLFDGQIIDSQISIYCKKMNAWPTFIACLFDKGQIDRKVENKFFKGPNNSKVKETELKDWIIKNFKYIHVKSNKLMRPSEQTILSIISHPDLEINGELIKSKFRSELSNRIDLEKFIIT